MINVFNILILSEEPTHGLDDIKLTADLTAKLTVNSSLAKYPINFTQLGKQFAICIKSTL